MGFSGGKESEENLGHMYKIRTMVVENNKQTLTNT